jgi:hypothetical protein
MHVVHTQLDLAMGQPPPIITVFALGGDHVKWPYFGEMQFPPLGPWPQAPLEFVSMRPLLEQRFLVEINWRDAPKNALLVEALKATLVRLMRADRTTRRYSLARPLPLARFIAMSVDDLLPNARHSYITWVGYTQISTWVEKDHTRFMIVTALARAAGVLLGNATGGISIAPLESGVPPHATVRFSPLWSPLAATNRAELDAYRAHRIARESGADPPRYSATR